MEAILNLPVGAFGGEETYGVSLQRGEIIAFIAGDFIMEATFQPNLHDSLEIIARCWLQGSGSSCRVERSGKTTT
jgi:hypothetical protein